MENGEEATEVTAMTSGECGMSSDESGTTSLDGAESRMVGCHQKKLLKQHLKSRQGRCIFGMVVFTLLAMVAHVLSKLIMGFLFINSCQLEPFIPIYLITGSSLFIAFAGVLVIIIIKCRREEDDDRVSPAHLLTFVYFFIHLVLQLAGSVCVIKTKNFITSLEIDYATPGIVGCSDTLLSYSFGVVVFDLILSGLLFIFAVVSLVEVIYIECCQSPSKTQTKSCTVR